jgi:hypothetical protein
MSIKKKTEKKYRNTKSTDQKEKNSKKMYVSYLKSVKDPNIRIGATRRNLQAQPKMLRKIVGTSNQPIRRSEQKKFTKNYF